MAQILTASRINDSGFATGLSPEVTITNISTGIAAELVIINNWVKNASILVQHTTDLS